MLILQIASDASSRFPCKVAPLGRIGTNSTHKFFLVYFLFIYWVILCEKKYLLDGSLGVCYERVNGLVSERVRDVCSSTINNQSNFLFLFRVHVTWYFCLFQMISWNFCFSPHNWLQLKLASQWLKFTQSE